MLRSQIAAFVAIVVLAAPSIARADDSSDAFTSQALRPGSWSLQFRVVDNFQLRSFDGAAISATHFSSERAAWRMGVSFGLNTANLSRTQDALTDTTSTRAFNGDGSNGAQNIAVDLTRILYPAVEGRVRPYLGLGPTAGYGHTSQEAETDNPAIGDRETTKFTSSTWLAGARFVLGVEVFAARRISLLGEYTSSLTYIHRHDTDLNVFVPAGPGSTSGTDFDQVSKGWSFGQDGVRLGVSAYF